MTEWREEYEGILDRLNYEKSLEKNYKIRLREHNQILKDMRKGLSKCTRIRKKLQREADNFWKKKKSSMYRHRKWAQENPGKALDNITGKG
jgi:hypothetical protein